jgi:hypothetical protein
MRCTALAGWGKAMKNCAAHDHLLIREGRSSISLRELLEFVDDPILRHRADNRILEHLPAMPLGDASFLMTKGLEMDRGVNESSPKKGRNFLMIRRPAHRHGRIVPPNRKVNQAIHEIKVVPAVVLFSTFITIAIFLSLFVK